VERNAADAFVWVSAAEALPEMRAGEGCFITTATEIKTKSILWEDEQWNLKGKQQ
jgi:hypothetical protein